LNEALKEDPDFFRANLTLAFVSLNPDNQGEFKKFAEKAINTKSDLSDGEMLLKKALTRLYENPQSDVTDIGEELIDLYPKDESVYNFQAMLQNLNRDYKGSEKTYTELLKITDEPGPVYNQLGYAYMNMGDFEAAQKAFDQYIQLVPNHPNPYDSKGDYYMATKDFKNAYESYIKAHEINENWSYDKALKAKELMDKSAVSETADKK
jgi:Flp pilus assembly protein TadD